MTDSLSPTSRTRVRRYPRRGRADRAELYAVLDAGLLCFFGTIVDGFPRVVPMGYGRIGDNLYLHGSIANQNLVAARDGAEVCVTVANVDGVVLANSLFHHSVNFHSAMIYGRGRLVTDLEERIAALHATADQLVPGRSAAVPKVTEKQLAATMVLSLSLHEASVKVRVGPPNGEPDDYETDVWAGVLPLQQTWGYPEQDPKLRPGIPVPRHVSRLIGETVGDRARLATRPR